MSNQRIPQVKWAECPAESNATGIANFKGLVSKHRKQLKQGVGIYQALYKTREHQRREWEPLKTNIISLKLTKVFPRLKNPPPHWFKILWAIWLTWYSVSENVSIYKLAQISMNSWKVCKKLVPVDLPWTSHSKPWGCQSSKWTLVHKPSHAHPMLTIYQMIWCWMLLMVHNIWTFKKSRVLLSVNNGWDWNLCTRRKCYRLDYKGKCWNCATVISIFPQTYYLGYIPWRVYWTCYCICTHWTLLFREEKCAPDNISSICYFNWRAV